MLIKLGVKLVSRCIVPLVAGVLMAASPAVLDANRAFAAELWRSEIRKYPKNDSYYQLVDDRSIHDQGVEWREARARAATFSYKGRKGRLAIVDTGELYAWLLETFNLRARSQKGYTWIGLRYLCPTRDLLWVTGQEHPPSGFAAWDTPWHREDGIRCSTVPRLPYMGVFIAGERSRWQATGYRKRYRNYFIEYPAPKAQERELSRAKR